MNRALPHHAELSTPNFWLVFGSLHELRHTTILPSLASLFFTSKRTASMANEFGTKVLARPQMQHAAAANQMRPKLS
jgi:hypothetical protein